MENIPSYDTILSQIGCKNTKSRKKIIEVLTGAEVPLSAEEIFLNVRKSGSTTNLSTVYRTLDLLESKGLLEKSIMSDGRARFKLVLEGHKHHITCINCYKSIPINTCPIELFEKDLVDTTDFNITGHKLEVYGLCPKCRKGE